MQGATPRPWHRNVHWIAPIYGGIKPNYKFIAYVPNEKDIPDAEKQANYELIIAAVNEHDARVRVCEAAEAYMAELDNPEGDTLSTRDELRAALASLKGAS